MAGTLVSSTLSDGTNSTSSTNCIRGSAKAWVNFNGTTSPGTIRASYNVASVTKFGTGSYGVNMTNALADVNYSIVATASVMSTLAGSFICAVPNTSSGALINTYKNANDGNSYDNSQISIAIFR